MIDLGPATREVKKLSDAALKYPPEKEGMQILARALAKNAKSEAHAARVIECWIETCPDWPKPAGIISLCDSLDDPAREMARNREECQRCGGTGWCSVKGPHGTSAAYPCTHGHGHETDADRRMGVRLHPSVAAHYRQLDIEALSRAEKYIGHGGRKVKTL